MEIRNHNSSLTFGSTVSHVDWAGLEKMGTDVKQAVENLLPSIKEMGTDDVFVSISTAKVFGGERTIRLGLQQNIPPILPPAKTALGEIWRNLKMEFGAKLKKDVFKFSGEDVLSIAYEPKQGPHEPKILYRLKTFIEEDAKVGKIVS